MRAKTKTVGVGRCLVDVPGQANLLLKMETGTDPRTGGKPVGSSLHDDTVMELWDSIWPSSRLRKTDAAPEPHAPDLATRGNGPARR